MEGGGEGGKRNIITDSVGGEQEDGVIDIMILVIVLCDRGYYPRGYYPTWKGFDWVSLFFLDSLIPGIQVFVHIHTPFTGLRSQL